jgi:peroxiredoxin
MSLTVVLVAGAVLVGGASMLALRTPSPAVPVPPLPTSTPSAAPRSSFPAAVDAALKELDLIRPARPKLAEDFTVARLGGGRFRLAEHRGKTLLINFWATWCPPCREEMPAMERLWQHHKNAGFMIVAISVDADPKVVAPYIEEHGYTIPVMLDPTMEVANAYAVRGLPSSFVIDRDGGLVAVAIGPRAWDHRASHAMVDALVR